MATKRGPTLRSQWLGQRLRELRESANLTLKDVATFTQRDASSISRMEAGIHPARVPDVLAYISLCGASDEAQRKALVQLAKDSRQTGWWDRYADHYGTLIDRIWLESRATEINSFDAIVIPGHLQTRDYATAVIRASNLEGNPEEIARDVELRMQRQELIDTIQSTVINVVLDESVLHRQVGGRATMRSQLLHLAEQADRPRTRIAILPWSSGAHGSPDGGFDVIKLQEPYPNVGYVPSPAGAVFLEGTEVDRLADRFHRLQAMALGPKESRSLIIQVTRELEVS